MLQIDKIRSVELEISSFCSARCPLCPRNIFGYPYENGFKPRHLTLSDVKHILPADFIAQLTEIVFEGNLGDFNMNPEALDIVMYLRSLNTSAQINIMTNGAIRNKKFWQDMVIADAKITFALDGLADTHSLYRKDTVWQTVIDNARAFIDAGGNAVWKMIRFDHNQHQIDKCRRLSKELGFHDFQLIDHGRNKGPVFDRKGDLEYILGDWQGETNLQAIMDTILHGDMFLEDIDHPATTSVSCQSLSQRQIYVSAEGNIYPCCFMGFNPDTFGHGTWHQPVNAQIKTMIHENNALEYPLKHCLEWFDKIPKCWQAAGTDRLVVCDHHCASASVQSK